MPAATVCTVTESWVDRGDLLSAHYCMNCSIDLLLKTVFALNKEFLPPPKWRVFYFRNLKWLHSNHGLLKDAINVKRLTVEDLNRRSKSLKAIRQVILVKVQKETGLSPDQSTKYYVERVLHQTPVH